MDRAQKAAWVATMHESFMDAGLVVVTQQTGMSVAEMTDLRRKVREVDARFKVTKNRLTRLALEGTQYEALKDVFSGPTGVVLAADAVSCAKVCVEFANKNKKLTLVGGSIGGAMFGADGVEALSKLPSLEELRARIIGVVQAPASKLVGVLPAPAEQVARLVAAPGGQLARVFAAYGAKEAA